MRAEGTPTTRPNLSSARAYDEYDSITRIRSAGGRPVTPAVAADRAAPGVAAGTGEPSDVAFRLDAAAMTSVVHERWTSLVRLATLLLAEPAVAEEVVQEACENVWRRRPEVDSQAQPCASGPRRCLRERSSAASAA